MLVLFTLTLKCSNRRCVTDFGNCIDKGESNCGFLGDFECINQPISRLSSTDTTERRSCYVFCTGIPVFKSDDEGVNSGFTNLTERQSCLETDTGDFRLIFKNSNERINRGNRFEDTEYGD